MKESIWLGWDDREAGAFAVARHSIQRRLTSPIPVRGLILDDLIRDGLYTRPTEMRVVGGVLMHWDVISEAPMSTQHAIARFLTPIVAKEGWALFMDGDVLVRENLVRLFEGLDPKKAVYCVKHNHNPSIAIKMDGQAQLPYPRKNWSSICVYNASHPSNARLTPELINTLPGRDLHRYCWLEDEEIGELDPKWNHLVGVSRSNADPAISHFTLGIPDMNGFADQPFAEEWFEERRAWAR